MGIKIIRDGKVIQEDTKSPLEQRIIRLEQVIEELQGQIKVLLKRDVKKTNKKTSVG